MGTQRRLADGDTITIGAETIRFSAPGDSRPVPGSLAPATLLHRGQRVFVGEHPVLIGRADDSDVVIDDLDVSRRHARVWQDGTACWLEDMGSRRGTMLNEETLTRSARRLFSGDAITVGPEVLRFVGGSPTRLASRPMSVAAEQVVPFAGARLRIGRDDANDIVLADQNVSRFHAEIVAGADGAEVVDLASRNGTRLDGSLVQRGAVRRGSRVGIGPYELVFDGTNFVARDDRGALRLEAEAVAFRVGDRQILAPTSLAVEPGEFIAIIGESGAGKSTLIKALAGVTRPSGGRVLVNRDPIGTRATDIGYVPQDEIVHALLSVTEALGYAARLRLPRDVADGEIMATIDRVLAELSLTAQGDTRIGSLSGGQRKRTGVATELLNRPSLLFLDEPTTGLDPGLETRTMELLRGLADNGRAVIVVTHATKNLALCDKVIVMGRGGHLAFHGSPSEAIGFFGVPDFDEIYTALEDDGAEDVAKALRRAPGSRASPPRTTPRSRRKPRLELRRDRRSRRFASFRTGTCDCWSGTGETSPCCSGRCRCLRLRWSASSPAGCSGSPGVTRRTACSSCSSS